ncbi:hypothetical protein [Streptomyces sp. NPDC048473]|uniref:hypothetical protein n=1 Tax=unclassified Streptomyces TaxID=2593676 RepID=UPI0037150977
MSAEPVVIGQHGVDHAQFGGGPLAGRPEKPRTTLYGDVPQERVAAAAASDGNLPELLPVLSD